MTEPLPQSRRDEGLKPCPFCGGSATVLREGNRRHSAQVSCDECGVVWEGPNTAGWNLREIPSEFDEFDFEDPWEYTTLRDEYIRARAEIERLKSARSATVAPTPTAEASSTPRTDRIVAERMLPSDRRLQAVHTLVDLARQLERELAEEVADKKRILEWARADTSSAIRDNLERAERVLKAWAGWNGPMVEDDAFTMQEQAKKYFALKNEAPQESLAGPVRGDGSVEQGTAVASPRRFQGGLSNDELRAAWGAKVPSVQPTEAELTAFALGIEVGDSLPAELPSATQPNPAPPEYRHTYAARTGWTPEQWDKVWREHAEEHERLAHHARSEIGRLNGVDKHDVPTAEGVHCACRFERREDPDFSGRSPVQFDECGFHSEQRRKLERELAEKTDRLNAALIRLKGLHGLRLEGEPKPIDNSRFFKEQKSEAPQAESSDVPVVESGHGAARRPAVASPHSSEKDRAVMPLEPTAAMIEEGAQRLVRLETGEEVWPDSWDWLQVRAARQEAERVWRSMWLAASDTSSATPYQLPWTPEETARRFHEAYEHFAPAFGYKTRSDTREWNSDSANGRLMIAVIRNVLIEQVVCE